MEIAAAISTAITVIDTLIKMYPQLVGSFNDVKDFGETIYKQFRGTEVSDAELDILEARIDELHRQLQEPLPPE